MAVVLSCLWAGTEAASVRVSGATLPVVGVVLDILRGAAWFGFLIVLMRPLWGGGIRWPAYLAVGVLTSQLLALVLELTLPVDTFPMRPMLAAWLAHAVVGLMFVEHLYRALPGASRWGIKPLCIALGAGYIFELYLFADAALFNRLDADVLSVRGVAHALLIPLIGLAGTRSPSWTLRMAMSREMVFHSTALAVAGIYLLVIAAAAAASKGTAFSTACAFSAHSAEIFSWLAVRLISLRRSFTARAALLSRPLSSLWTSWSCSTVG